MDEVRNFMEKTFVSIDPKSTVMEACKLMEETKASSILVKDGLEHIGVFTATDLLRKVIAPGFSPEEFTVEAAMSSPVYSIEADKSMVLAFLQMHQKNTRHIAVKEKRKIIGIISMKEVARYYVNKFAPKKN